MEKAEYEEVINTIISYIKTIIGLFLIVVAFIILYSMYFAGEWWVTHIENDTLLALVVIAAMVSLSVGIILACSKLK